ncbi:MAG: efflux RND transporter periplasmic adaptor subunit [bacterium]
MKTHHIIHSFMLLCLALPLLQCSSDSGGNGQSGANALVPAVEAVQARFGSLPLTERLSGVVKARNQIDIYAEVSAVVAEVLVNDGELVERGQPLLKLRDREFQERLKQADAGLEIAAAQAKQAAARLKEVQSELSRSETMAERGLISDTELENVQTKTVSAEADFELAEARVRQSQATVDERREALSQTIVRAPVAGTVGSRNVEVGMLVSSGSRLFTLGQLDSVRIEVVLTDRMLDYIEVGQNSDIFAESGSFDAAAPLTRVSPFLNPVTHSTEAEIDLANPDQILKPGMFVTVDIHYGESAQATLVPLSAIYENPATGGVGIYRSREQLNRDELTSDVNPQATTLTNPVLFEFVPIEVIAKGRMEAGVRGVEPQDWVVTIGQDLLGSDSAMARVRPVSWGWVEELQNLQREDLLDEVIQERPGAPRDTSSLLPQQPISE